jgi:membrane protein DedA with SNARE-associated domain
MTGSTSVGMLLLVLAIAAFVLVGLFYFGGRRRGPHNGLDRDRR